MKGLGFLVGALLVLSSHATVSASRVAKVEVSDQLCDTCLVTARVMSDFLCDPAATEFVLDLMEKQICPSLPDVDQCDQIAEALVPVLIQWLRASATPAELCASAGVCASTLAALPHMNRAHPVKDDMGCALCTFVINRAKSVLADPATQEQIKQAATAACQHLPAEMVSSCTDMVNNYEALLVALVESEDTMQACSLMGMCMGSLTSMIKPVPLPVPLLHAVHTVRPALEKLMALAPARHRMGMGCGKGSKKESAVESSKAEGKATYAHGSLLSGVVSPLLMQQQANEHAASVQQDGCDTCKMAVIEVHALLASPDVVTSATSYVKALCAQAPADWQPTCTSMADAYVPMAVTALQNYVAHPDAVCEMMHFCQPPSMMQKLFGALRMGGSKAVATASSSASSGSYMIKSSQQLAHGMQMALEHSLEETDVKA